MRLKNRPYIKGSNSEIGAVLKVGFAKKFLQKISHKKGGLLVHHHLLYSIFNVIFRYIRNV